MSAARIFKWLAGGFAVMLLFLVLVVGGAAGGGSSSRSNGGEQLAAVAVAEFQAGEADGTHNSGGSKYLSYCGMSDGTAWCAAFVSWCAGKCGFVDSGLMPKSGSHQACLDWVVADSSKGTWHKNDGAYVPAVGDLAVWCNGTTTSACACDPAYNVNNDNSYQHVGIVTAVDADAKTFTVTHGNWGNVTAQTQFMLGHDVDTFVKPAYPKTSSVDLAAPLTAGQTCNLPTSHEHRAPDGNGSIECGEVRGTATNLGGPYAYCVYPSLEGKWGNGAQAEVCSKWVAGGRASTNGVASINGYYLVATCTRFGAVGDYLKVTMSDGSSIDCIIADAKSDSDTSPPNPNESCMYGHYYTASNQVSVLEFETMSNTVSGSVEGMVPELQGNSVASVTNLGSIF